MMRISHVLILSSLLYAQQAKAPTLKPLTVEERAEIALQLSQLNEFRVSKEQLHVAKEAAVRKAVEEWYASPAGRRLGLIQVQEDQLKDALEKRIAEVRKANQIPQDYGLDRDLNWIKR